MVGGRRRIASAARPHLPLEKQNGQLQLACPPPHEGVRSPGATLLQLALRKELSSPSRTSNHRPLSSRSCSPRMDLGLEVLLRLAWVAGILPVVVASLPISRLRRFHGLVSTFANRGKTSLSSSQSFTVPHSYFLHFYIAAVFWTTYLLASTWFYAYRKAAPESLHHSTIASHLMGGSHLFSIHKSPNMEYSSQIWRIVFLLLLMEAQVLRRLYETIYVFSYNASARMHIFGYLTGIFFYMAAPVSLCSSIALEVLSYTVCQINEFVVKGGARTPADEFAYWGYVKPLMKVGWCQWIGAAIFFLGWIHQYRCHAVLGSLRKQIKGDEYVVPHGDWFEVVSCAHYLAEIVIYAGILMASGGLDVTVWLLFAFVASNLIFAAAETHRWYLHKFDSYPRSRNAIIPLIY